MLVIHGGAGLARTARLSPEREERAHHVLAAALADGHAVLSAGGSALDAVVAAVLHLEDDPVFNAGRGSVLGADGRCTLDASLMDGADRRAGAVAAATRIKNPILAARAVMEHTPHVLLVGSGADALAAEQGLELVDPDWFVTGERRLQLDRIRGTDRVQLDHEPAPDEYGTVGAVARDTAGHVATATSTGGMVNKRLGRVGDTPLVGAGTWADDRTCAVSGTGHGELFIRLAACARVSAYMELGGLDLHKAAARVVEDLGALGGTGGLIAVDAEGRFAMPFNSGGMFRGWIGPDGQAHTAIW